MQKYFNTNDSRIKLLLEIKDENTEYINTYQSGKDLFIGIKLKRKHHICPSCKTSTNSVHDYYTRKIKHGEFNNYHCFIIYKQRRYVCPNCSKKFNEDNNFVCKNKKLSNNLTLTIINKLKQKRSFKDIASELNISSHSVIRTHDIFCKSYSLKLPEVLSIDEFKGNTGEYKYQVLLCDPINKNIIDVLPSRYKEYLKEYFKNIPLEERAKVKIFITDMWDTYRDIALEFLPNATIVTDTFHYVRHIFWAFNNTRVRIMKKYDKKSKEYLYLKTYWKSLIQRSNKLNAKYSHHNKIKQLDSQMGIVDNCLNFNDELCTAYILKEEFFDIVDNAKRDDVEKLLKSWIIKANNSRLHEFREAANTISNWFEYIANSFIRDENQKKYTNGFIEGTNNYIKVIKRVSFGYRNFKRFRSRILFIHKNSRHTITC